MRTDGSTTRRQLLYCGPSNSAVDVAMSMFMSRTVYNVRVVRENLGDAQHFETCNFQIQCIICNFICNGLCPEQHEQIGHNFFSKMHHKIWKLNKTVGCLQCEEASRFLASEHMRTHALSYNPGVTLYFYSKLTMNMILTFCIVISLLRRVVI